MSTSATWKDPDTGLMWAANDNGFDVTQLQALDYCRNLSLAGFTDWRLPEIGELAQLYDPSVVSGSWTNSAGGSYDLHAKGGIWMTAPFEWSATSGNSSGEAWFLFFASGSRSSLAVGDSTRALCVRRSGE